MLRKRMGRIVRSGFFAAAFMLLCAPMSVAIAASNTTSIGSANSVSSAMPSNECNLDASAGCGSSSVNAVGNNAIYGNNPVVGKTYYGSRIDAGVNTTTATYAAVPIDAAASGQNLCRYVINSDAKNSYFVPFKSATEWQDFINNHPSNIAMSHCSRPYSVASYTMTTVPPSSYGTCVANATSNTSPTPQLYAPYNACYIAGAGGYTCSGAAALWVPSSFPLYGFTCYTSSAKTTVQSVVQGTIASWTGLDSDNATTTAPNNGTWTPNFIYGPNLTLTATSASTPTNTPSASLTVADSPSASNPNIVTLAWQIQGGGSAPCVASGASANPVGSPSTAPSITCTGTNSATFAMPIGTSSPIYTYTVKGTGSKGTTSSSSVVINGVPPVTVSMAASPPTIILDSHSPNSSTLTWSTTNVGGGGCALSSSDGTYNGAPVANNNTTGTPVSPSQNTTYTLTCTDGVGSTVSQTTTVTMVAAVTDSLALTSPSIFSGEGESSQLTWASSNTAASGSIPGGTCLLSSTDGTYDNLNVALNNSTGIAVSPSSSTTYTLTCDDGLTGNGSSAIATVILSVNTPVSIQMSASQPVIIAGSATSTISWTATNAVSCSAVTPSNWTAVDTTSGSQIGTITDSQSVSPNTTTTYKLSCTDDLSGNGSSATQTATVNVVDAVSVALSASPPTILPGNSTTLTWSASNVGSSGSCLMDNSIGPVLTVGNGGTSNSGTLVVSPTTTTTYAIVCGNGLSGGGSSAKQTTTVTVSTDGWCGSDNQATLSSPPTNLCNIGLATPSTLTGYGPWSWTCSDINSGQSTSCSANPPCPARYTGTYPNCTGPAVSGASPPSQQECLDASANNPTLTCDASGMCKFSWTVNFEPCCFNGQGQKLTWLIGENVPNGVTCSSPTVTEENCNPAQGVCNHQDIGSSTITCNGPVNNFANQYIPQLSLKNTNVPFTYCKQ